MTAKNPDVICVVGARPNFPKVAPILRALDAAGLTRCVVDTGQHYDEQMAGVFVRDLGMPRPDVALGVGSASHGKQTARVLEAFEQVLIDLEPRSVVVVGDVNSTMACALAAAKLHIPCAHVEAGLRSRDRAMPEEINRQVTDVVCDLLLTPSADADENLINEGIPAERIRRVGNVMIDTLVWALPRARALGMAQSIGVVPGHYALVTLHRPTNVDHAGSLGSLVDVLARTASRLPVVFPVHPRTRHKLEEFALVERLEQAGVKLLDPLGYLECLSLEAEARVVLTDSGGIQEETTVLGVPCLTVRDSTERPITVSEGTNRVVGTDGARVLEAIEETLAAKPEPRRVPAMWDGRTAERIVLALSESFGLSLRRAAAPRTSGAASSSSAAAG